MNKIELQNKFFNLYCLEGLLRLIWNHSKSAKWQRNLQNQLLQRLMYRAYEVPFYKKRFDQAGIGPDAVKTKKDLAKLPVLTKADYRDWMLQEDKRPSAKYFKRSKTSGSTGIPITNIYPPKEYAMQYAIHLFGWLRGGYNPFFGKTLTQEAADESVGSHMFVQKLGILRRECFQTGWDRERIIRKIRDYKPDLIEANAAELMYIAQYSLEHSLSFPKPRYYTPNGENIDHISLRAMRKVYGDSLFSFYGCSEMATAAIRYPGMEFFQVLEDIAAVNILDHGEIKEEGEGSLLLTSLYRMQYPIINYEVGDLGVLKVHNERDYIEKIISRKNDMFVWKSGKKTTWRRLYVITENLEDIYQIRFIQESYEKVTIQAVKDIHSKKSDRELEQQLAVLFKDVFDDGVAMNFQWMSVIPPDPNGKIRNMICMIPT